MIYLKMSPNLWRILFH